MGQDLSLAMSGFRDFVTSRVTKRRNKFLDLIRKIWYIIYISLGCFKTKTVIMI